MPHVLGPKSLRELQGVHPNLVRCVHTAIALCPVDFAVHDGLRTQQEQQEYVAKGVSRTMNSKHLPQADGFGHAVDLVPYINGKLRWEWAPIYEIASCVAKVANAQGLILRWGGVWDRQMPGDFGDLSPGSMAEAVRAYTIRQQERGRSAFIDGPHFELA